MPALGVLDLLITDNWVCLRSSCGRSCGSQWQTTCMCGTAYNDSQQIYGQRLVWKIVFTSYSVVNVLLEFPQPPFCQQNRSIGFSFFPPHSWLDTADFRHGFPIACLQQLCAHDAFIISSSNHVRLHVSRYVIMILLADCQGLNALNMTLCVGTVIVSS